MVLRADPTAGETSKANNSHTLYFLVKNMQEEEIISKGIMSHSIVSRQGGRNENQDAFGECETKDGRRLFVVCDGMGGMRGGSTASNLAVKTIKEEVAGSSETDPERLLTLAIQKANHIIYQLGMSREDLRGMGTTVAVLLISGEKATAAHVGDSRIYQLRGKRKVFRTFDHSMVFELVKRGRITEEEARLSAESNIISRALGIKPEVEVEVTGCLPYLEGDRFMLCTDGISGVVKESRLLELAANKKPVEETVEELAGTIDRTGIESGGGHDNLTAALIELHINSKIKPAMDKRSKLVILLLSLLLLLSIALNVYLWARPQAKGAPVTTVEEQVSNPEEEPSGD
jgi:serine/threonine protein phosphatase PrpC